MKTANLNLTPAWIHTDSLINRVFEFQSPAAITRVAEGWEKQTTLYESHEKEFFGNQSLETINRKGKEGDATLVDKARKLINEYGDTPESHSYRTHAAIVGGRANVPAALAGHPMSMFRRDKVRTESAPISIAASVSVSASVDATEIEAHGAAVLALAMRFCADRPTRLFLFGENQDATTKGNIYTVVNIETSPLDLASACYALTNAGWRRAVRLAVTMGLNGHTGMFARDMADKDYGNKVRARLHLSDTDILLTGVNKTLDGKNYGNYKDWVEATYRKYSALLGGSD